MQVSGNIRQASITLNSPPVRISKSRDRNDEVQLSHMKPDMVELLKRMRKLHTVRTTIATLSIAYTL
ncbi:predicted protein [Plenodomus lingam JN3]|uniref:Predicted protein n=1 Tax=Leptosphaeria maculans (strain JN3 / isolate v23.1.3 / race Av1-4-5-6-7-8) TaxID=985895 RepID=E4ZQ15_LEPMJ|nr:predicted protein [Plenodomus lingam JN3]CBX93550.1 predicted protein [Plenodomus lingam JN3]